MLSISAVLVCVCVCVGGFCQYGASAEWKTPPSHTSTS